MEKSYPLIIVFYLDRNMMENKQVIQPFADSVNKIIALKKLNAVAFFIPTDKEERVECINPVIVSGDEMDKINKVLEDIRSNFLIGSKYDLPDINIEIKNDENE